MDKDKIEIGIYYYEDDNGKKVYDIDEMFAELDREICKLQDKEND